MIIQTTPVILAGGTPTHTQGLVMRPFPFASGGSIAVSL